MSLNARKFAISSFALLAARIAAVLCSFIQVPVSLHYLGQEAFGLWATLTSLLLLLNFADLGIANGLQNRLAHHEGLGNQIAGRTTIGTAFTCLAAIGIILLVILFPILAQVNWSDILHLKTTATRSEALHLILLFTVFFCLGLPLTLSQKIALARQQNTAFAASQLATSALVLLAVVVGAQMSLGLLPFFLFTLAPQYISNAALAIYLHKKSPGKYHFSRSETTYLFKLSSGFIFPQIGSAVLSTAPPLILAILVGVTATASYNICQRLFTPLNLIIATILTPLWPAYSVAKAQNNGMWIKRTFFLTFFGIACLAGFYCLLIILFSESVLTIWIGKSFTIPVALIVTFSALTFVVALGQAVATLLNGLSVLKRQSIYGTISTAISIALMFYLGRIYGAPGIIAAQLIPYCLIAAPPVFTEAFSLAIKSGKITH